RERQPRRLEAAAQTDRLAAGTDAGGHPARREDVPGPGEEERGHDPAEGARMTPKATNPRKLTFDRLHVEPRTADRFTLANGIVVHAMADPEVPVVRLGALLRTGSVWDPAEGVGAAWMTAQ